MRSKRHITFGLKSIIIMMMVLLASFSIMCATQHNKTYATEGSGDDNDHTGELGIHDGWGLPSSSKTGWLVYIQTVDGETPYPVVAMTNGTSFKGDTSYLYTVFGVSPSSFKGTAPWGAPWKGNTRAGRGQEIKNGLLNKEGSYYWRVVIMQLWGQSVLDDLMEEPDKYYLVLESVAFHAVNPSSSGGDAWHVATEHTWALIDGAAGLPDRGSSATGWCNNSVLVDSCYLDKEFPGLPSVPTIFPGSNCKIEAQRLPRSLTGDTSIGYGMIAVRLKDDAIHTYWEPHDSPGYEEPAEPNKVGHYNMVKAYYTKYMKNGVVVDKKPDGTYAEPNCIPNISVDDEPKEYHLEYWVTGSDYDAGADFASILARTGPQSGTGAKIIKLSKEERNEQTVYVVLVREKNETEEEDYNYLMTQSMITRTIWLNYPDFEDGMALPMNYDFTWKSPAHPTECDGHDCAHGHWEDRDNDGKDDTYVDETQTGECTVPKWYEHKIKFSLYNGKKYDFPKIVATREDLEGVEVEDIDGGTEEKRWEPMGTPEETWGWDERQDDEMTSESVYETSSKYDWDYICVLMRGADKLTVAQTANDGGWRVLPTSANEDLAEASSEGFAVADTKQGTRKTDDYYEHFNNLFKSDKVNGGDYSTTVYYSKQWVCPKCGTTFGVCYDTKEYTLYSPLSCHVVVKIETYSGNPNGGWEDQSIDDSSPILLGSLSDFPDSGLPSKQWHSGRMVNAGNKISFLPYVYMKYQTRSSGLAGWHDTLTDKDSGWLEAYVLGQYTRSINPNDYAEVHWSEKEHTPNMQLLSNQWSTHALATESWNTNNVIPGGATLGLKIPSDDRQTIYASTMQCYTEGFGRDQCEKTGGDPGDITRADCEATHMAFVREVADSIDNTNVQQWQRDVGSKNMSPDTDEAWTGNGIKVNRGESLSGINVSGTRSSDDEKYYFGDLVSGSNKGDYDVDIRSTTTHTYTFVSDAKSGAIVCYKDNTSPKETDPTYNGPMIAAIEARTLVVTKLTAAVEQAVEGDDTIDNDKDCSDDKALNQEEWYNEEFDGITVIVQETEILTGFYDPAERTEVIDPKLTKTQDSKGGEMGMNFDNKSKRQETYECGQIKTRNYSESFGESYPEVVAYFKGKTVQMHRLEYLYWTRKFWIPNFTVQDIY